MRNVWAMGFCLCYFLDTIAFAVQSADTTVIRLDGSRATGTLRSITDSEIELTAGNGKVQIARQEIKSILFAEPDPSDLEKMRAKYPITLELLDGSILRASDVSGANDTWQVESAQGQRQFGANVASNIQFRPVEDKELTAWDALKLEKRAADEIIISRGAGNIDRASGLINSINKETVSFDFEGQNLNAPRAKLVGAIWFRQPLERIQPAARVKLLDGSIWLATNIQWMQNANGEQLKWKTALGVEWNCSKNQVLEIDLSAANVKWLAEADVLERRSADRMVLATPIAVRDKLFGPHFTVATASAIELDKDLIFASPGEITFRVPDGFRFFAAKVGRRSTGDSRSLLKIEIWQAEEKIFQGELPDDLSDISVKVGVTPGKRLRITVLSDSSLAAGTKVQWTQPRFER